MGCIAETDRGLLYAVFLALEVFALGEIGLDMVMSLRTATWVSSLAMCSSANACFLSFKTLLIQMPETVRNTLKA